MTLAAASSTSLRPPRPEVTIVPFDSARDAAAYSRVRVLAFKDTFINHRIWPAPRPSEEDRIRYDLRSESRSHVPPDAVRLTALVEGKPVGFAVWMSPVDRTATLGEPTEQEAAAAAAREAELDATKEAIDHEIDGRMDKAFLKAFKKATSDARNQRFQGRPFWHLDLLCIDPESQGMGVGKKLLNWGFARADRDRKAIYLEATPAGEPVYLRNNFEIVNRVTFTDKDGVLLSLPAMERPPQPVASSGLPLPPPSDAEIAKAASNGTTRAASSAKPAVKLSLVEDDDWPEVIRTKLLAMEGDPLAETASPVHLRPDLETRIKWNLYTQRRMSPAVLHDYAYVKATLASDPQRVLGFAVWEKPRFPSSSSPDPAPKGEATLRVDEELEALIASTEDRAFLKGFKGRARQIREDYHQGRPHWYLSLLVVHPESQGLGVGRQLILWGTDQADASGIACHCESSPVGEKVYPRFGFEPVAYEDWTHISGSPMRSPSFCRPPKAA